MQLTFTETIVVFALVLSTIYGFLRRHKPATSNLPPGPPGIPLLGIGQRCHIENAIIDKNCCIGDDVKIIGGKHLADTDNALFTIKDGIVVVKKGAIFSNGFSI